MSSGEKAREKEALSGVGDKDGRHHAWRFRLFSVLRKHPFSSCFWYFPINKQKTWQNHAAIQVAILAECSIKSNVRFSRTGLVPALPLAGGGGRAEVEERGDKN